MKVLNYGSLNLDYTYSVPHIVVPGETITSTKLEIFPGGKGLNQSIALSKAGMEVYHAGQIGEDGGMLLDVCRENHVHTDYIRTVPVRTGNAIIQLDEGGQNSIVLFPGANRTQEKDTIDEVLTHFEAGDVLILQNEINLIEYLITQAFAKQMIIVLNPSPFDDAVLACDLSKITYFLMNEVEGEMLTGETEPDKILKTMRSRYPSSKVVLTLGGNGSIYSDQTTIHRQPIYRVPVTDTTAAGDTFTGYFLKFALTEGDIPKALDMASYAAALAVSRKGAAVSIPKLEEVLNRS